MIKNCLDPYKTETGRKINKISHAFRSLPEGIFFCQILVFGGGSREKVL
jgi:hypothetical protein